MTRPKKHHRRPLDGILLLDKPSGITSNHILQKIKRLYQAEKAGHTGTLDPMATGLLPIAFGEATKFSQHLLEAYKSYQFTCQLGVKTSTGDREGKIKKTKSIPSFDKATLLSIFKNFLGETEQIPPMVSALKHQGRKLYELEREGIEIERKPRKIIIKSLILDSFTSSSFTATVTSSKGTYVRTLAEDIAHQLGSLGHLTHLRRLSIDPFSSSVFITYESLLKASSLEELDHFLLPMDASLSFLPKWIFTEEESKRFLYGQRIPVKSLLDKPLYRIYSHNNFFLGVGEPQTPTTMAPKRLTLRYINQL